MDDFQTRLLALVVRATKADSDAVSAQTRFEEIPEWSSLRALRLLAAVEAEFDVQLDLREYLLLETVAQLSALITESFSPTV